jgi:RNA polymerase sigma factor (sigma-70 family)
LPELLKIKTFSDVELIHAFIEKGDNYFLEELYGRYIRFVFLICMKYLKNAEEAKDISMQVFEKLCDDLKRFNVRNFKSWLHVVTKNTCLMHLRSEKDVVSLDHVLQTNMQNIMENHYFLHPENEAEEELSMDKLKQAMGKLNVEQKKCIELFYFEERSYKEVVEITGFSMNEVKSFIQNGKRNLKILLMRRGELTLYLLAYFLFCK